ncbi:MAG: hypothetical protein E5Y51_05710 [Mesorhizobium sp.]|nr:MAG: hypothetical protein E5Y51_05710 [Mesorhizobium sp.]
MAADLVKDIGEEIGAAVDHLRVIAEGRRRIDEAEQLDDAHDAPEVARRRVHDGKQVEAGEPGMLIGLFDGDVLADLAGAKRAIGAQRPLAREEDQPAALGMSDEVGDGRWRPDGTDAAVGHEDDAA